MTLITICIGVFAIVAASIPLRGSRTQLIAGGRFWVQLFSLALVSIWLVIGMLLVVLAWSLLLQYLGVFKELETSLYFSLISFTTVGYGDVVPSLDWRVLTGFISIDGFLMFGLNTAFLFEILRRMRDD